MFLDGRLLSSRLNILHRNFNGSVKSNLEDVQIKTSISEVSTTTEAKVNLLQGFSEGTKANGLSEILGAMGA